VSEYNVLDHVTVPNHDILDSSDVKTVLSTYNAKLEDLPKIKINDPVIREIGASVGDVVRITRSSETGGKVYYYRLVIE